MKRMRSRWRRSTLAIICFVSIAAAPVRVPEDSKARISTLAFDADFSQPLPLNWLGGCPGGANGAGTDISDNTGHDWYNDIWWSPWNSPCIAKQVYDSVAGKLVLDLPFAVTGDYGQDYVGHVLQTASWYGDGVSFPNNAYYEVVAKLWPVANGVRFALNTWSLAGIVSQGAVTEWDVIEESLDEGPFGNLHNFGGAPNGFIWTSYDLNNLGIRYDVGDYHKIGLGVTSDGRQALGCGFVDDRLIRCVRTDLVGAEPTQRLFLMLNSHCDVWNWPSGCPLAGQTQHAYIQYVRVWSCADWLSSQCNGALLYGP